MRRAQIALAALVAITALAVMVELARFNSDLGGLPHMSASQTWRSPNLLSSAMFLLIGIVVASASSTLLPASRVALSAVSLFAVVSLVGLWALHRTVSQMMTSGTSGPISWW